MTLSASPFHYQNIYTPTRPSPLSERSANVLPRVFKFTMASQPQSEKKPIPQRPHKPNPVMQSRDAAAQRRRDMFFRRVQKDRDDKKWSARGEQIERLDVISDQKRWEAEKARQAPELGDDFIDENLVEDDIENTWPSRTQSNTSEQEMDEADYVLSQEENELQALIALMEEQEQQESASQHYGSDDEDYDQIFMKCTAEAEWQQYDSATIRNNEDVDAMDMTDG